MGKLGRDRPKKKWYKKAPLRMISDKGGVGKIKEIKERGGGSLRNMLIPLISANRRLDASRQHYTTNYINSSTQTTTRLLLFIFISLHSPIQDNSHTRHYFAPISKIYDAAHRKAKPIVQYLSSIAFS